MFLIFQRSEWMLVILSEWMEKYSIEEKKSVGIENMKWKERTIKDYCVFDDSHLPNFAPHSKQTKWN